MLIRNKFAHAPLDMGIDFETRKFEVCLRHVGVRSKSLTFESVQITETDLADANKQVANLYMRLIKHWGRIVGVSRAGLLSPDSP